MRGALARLLWSVFWLAALAGYCEAQTVYTFGVVPQFEPKKLASIWLPIFAEIEKETGLRLKMVGAPKIPEFERAFLAGEFDFAYMNPYHALLAGEAQGYVPLVRDHGRELFGILVVKKDAKVASIGDLDGRKIAFPSPNALGASLLMRADLVKEHGITFQPVYVKTHSSVYLHVALGMVSAGGGVYSTLQGQPPKIRDRLRVIYETRRMAPHPVMAHPRIPPSVTGAVRRAFVDMGRSERGRRLLFKVPILNIGEAKLEDYSKLHAWGLQAFFIESNGDSQ